MDTGLVKSAARALEILEVFAAERRPMSSTQLGVALGYPKSSLSVLLRSLVAQGYLSSGRVDGDYFPTLKVAQLGDWVAAAVLGSEAIIPALHALRDATGETVTLTAASGLQMRCLRALIGVHPISLQVEEGVSFPMMGTAIGTAYLAAQEEKQRVRLLERWAKQGAAASELADMRRHIEETTSLGYCAAYDIVIPDTGAVATAIRSPLKTGDPIMVVGVAGLNSRIRDGQAAIVAAMRKTLADWLEF
jgi:DNA-binding IclR family transcriptional regulator